MSKGKTGSSAQRGGFVLGMIVGLLVGLAIALGVALYITKVPVPFVNKLPQRTAEQDAEEAQRNRNWDPNAPLNGKAAKAASGVVSGTPAPAPSAPAPTATLEATPAKAPAAAASKPAAETKQATASAAAPAGDPNLYFVQVGAYTKAEDAEAQRAKLAMQGFTAKVFEREQSGRPVFRVRMGPIDTRAEAEDLQKKVEAVGVETNLVRVQR